MDISQFGTDLKKAYKVNQNAIDIELLKMVASKSLQQARFISDVDDRYIGTGKRLEKILQPYQKGFTPHTDKLKAYPEETIVKGIKINYELDSDELDTIMRSVLNHLTRGKKTKLDTKSAAKIMNWIFSNIAITQAREIETDIFYTGRYAAPTPGTPGDAVDSVDGIEKKIEDAVTAGMIAEITLGAYTDTTTFAHAEDYVKQLPAAVKYSGKKILLNCSPEYHEAAFYSRRADLGPNANYSENFEIKLGPQKNIVLNPLISMAGKKRIFNTLPGNMIWCHNQTGEENMLTVTPRPDEDVIRITGQFKAAPGFDFIGIPGGTSDTQLVWSSDEPI